MGIDERPHPACFLLTDMSDCLQDNNGEAMRPPLFAQEQVPAQIHENQLVKRLLAQVGLAQYSPGVKLHRTSSSHCRDRTSPRNVHFAPGTVVATYAKELPPSDSFHLPNDMGEDQAALDGMGLEGDEVHDVDEVAMILLGLRDHQKSWGCGVLCRCRGRSCL